MAENLTLSLRLLLNNRNLAQGLQQSKSAVSRFAGGVRDEVNSLKSTFNSLAGRIAQLGITISAVQQIIKSAKLDQSITRIGQTAKASQAQVAELRQELFNMAKNTGNDVEDLKNGFDSLIAAGQNWDQALASIKAINAAMAVTGASGETLASALTVASTAFDFDLAKVGEATKFLDEMTAAGREGNAELQSLADIISRIGTNAAAAGMSRQQALAFVETLSMVEKQPERLATLADSTLRLFNNQNYSKAAEKETGVKFFNKDGSRRQVMSIMTDMKFEYDKLKTDKAKNSFIDKAFGKADLDTQKGVKTLFTGDMIGKFETINQKINESSGTIAKDLPAAINNAVSQTGRLKSAMREAADAFAKPVNEAIAKTIKKTMDKKEDGGLELNGKEMIGVGLATTIAAILTAKFGGKLVKGMAGKFTSIGEGVATGKALEAAAGVTPVFVVNMPGSGIIDAIPGLPKGLPTKALDTAKKFAPLATIPAAAPYIGAGLGLAWSLDGLMKDTAYRDPNTGMKYENHGRGGGKWVQDDKPLVVNVHLDGKQISSTVQTRQTKESRRH